MAPDKDPYAGSPYDAAGMPLGTTYADYENGEERRKNQVKTRPVKHPESINDIDYQPKETAAEKEFKRRRPETPKEIAEFNAGFNGAVDKPIETPPEAVDIEDPAERRELLVKEADEKGFKETPELPKVEKKETVDEIKKDIKEEENDDSFLDEKPEDKKAPAKKDDKK